jgi:hypothetical protein
MVAKAVRENESGEAHAPRVYWRVNRAPTGARQSNLNPFELIPFSEGFDAGRIRSPNQNKRFVLIRVIRGQTVLRPLRFLAASLCSFAPKKFSRIRLSPHFSFRFQDNIFAGWHLSH